MNIIEYFIDFLVHLDKYLSQIIQTFGIWSYLILFLIIFCETGLVVAPFFPGDSLIFVSGTFAGTGMLRVEWLFVIFSLAAIIGDTVNYWIGHYVGPKVFRQKKSGFFKKDYLHTAAKFYEKHGGKTIVIARFIPVIRTFAPFVAGVGAMKYRRFIFYNIIGGIAWVSLFLFAGYFFGTLPAVQENLTLIIFAIILVSFLPPIIEFLRSRKHSK